MQTPISFADVPRPLPLITYKPYTRLLQGANANELSNLTFAAFSLRSNPILALPNSPLFSPRTESRLHTALWPNDRLDGRSGETLLPSLFALPASVMFYQ